MDYKWRLVRLTTHARDTEGLTDEATNSDASIGNMVFRSLGSLDICLVEEEPSQRKKEATVENEADNSPVSALCVKPTESTQA